MPKFKIKSIRFAQGILLGAIFIVGCGKGDADKDAGKSSDSIVGQGDSDAVKAVRDELNKHWVKTPDGWISEFPAKVRLGTGERAGPESFYRQIKELKFDVEPADLSESDKLNGYQFHAFCQFNHAPARIYGDPNAFGPPKWADWRESSEALRVDKKNGKWIVSDANGYLISGTIPTTATIAQLK